MMGHTCNMRERENKGKEEGGKGGNMRGQRRREGRRRGEGGGKRKVGGEGSNQWRPKGYMHQAP